MPKTPRPQVFLVTSQGYTATKWVAWALDSHPDIHCSHFTGGRASDRDYSLPELRELVDGGNVHEGDTLLRGFFRQLRTDAREEGKRFAGNAGAFSAGELDNEYMGKRHPPLRTVNIIRHPIPWVSSGAHHQVKECNVNALVEENVNDHMRRHRQLYARLGVPENPDLFSKAFCYMCDMRVLAYDAHLPWTQHYRTEDVTSDRGAFVEMVQDLTGLDVSGDTSYLDVVFGHGPIHRHNPSQATDPATQFREWKPWQRRVYEHWARHSGALSAYKQFGYDMSQIDDKRTARTGRKLTT